MTKVDLHVHSQYSKHPSEWFLKRIGAQESYTDIEHIYRIAKKNGMTYVTISDHNTIEGALRLNKSHPKDTFVSAEMTAYFPENGCKIHVLVFDIDDHHFREIDRLRTNIYELRDYLRENNIACSVAHATYNINNKLSMDVLEKLVLLFNVFETINGNRSYAFNQVWNSVLHSLDPDDIAALYEKYSIEPWGDTPWIKGFTGGSDDHAGLLIGTTYTKTGNPESDMREFLNNLRARKTYPEGGDNDFKSFALSLYKIAYEFYKTNSGNKGGRFWNLLNDMIFEDKKPGFLERMSVKKIRTGNNDQDRVIYQFIHNFIDGLGSFNDGNVHQYISNIYDNVATLTDDFFQIMLSSLEKDLKSGDPAKLFRNLSAFLPVLFMSTPVFSAFYHQNRERDLIEAMEKKYLNKEISDTRKILWFTDTIDDVNGVTVTLNKVAWAACNTNKNLKLVFCHKNGKINGNIPPNHINLDRVYSYSPDYYSNFSIQVPSILKSINIIHAEQPDEIIISTPGPMGILGLICAKLLKVRCRGIYHTDFRVMAERITDDESVACLVEAYIRWFYSQMDEIRVPSDEYIRILGERGYDRTRLKKSRRGLDMNVFKYNEKYRKELKEKHALNGGTTVLYAGRVSYEKNIGFLNVLFDELTAEAQDIRLIIAGNGPALEEMKKNLASKKNIIFTGELSREEILKYYSLADLFIFPSAFETFGMVILEAQACGLPALVTDQGGPKELLENGTTGYVLPLQKDLWKEKILHFSRLLANDPEKYARLREACRKNVETRFSWQTALKDIVET